MSMNLCIDQGNSSTKVGIFNGNELIDHLVFDKFDSEELAEITGCYSINACILSSVTNENKLLTENLISHWPDTVCLSHLTPIPVTNAYDTPETLGKDRLAAVIGANFLKPDSNLLVIDAGTAITYDFIDAHGVYQGGNIAPGLDMRLRAMHEFTQKLPLVSASAESPELGCDTPSAILAGAFNGIIFEIDGYIDLLKSKFPQLLVFLTGGSTFYLATKLKKTIFAEPNLVLIGLNRILQYNVQK